VQIFFQQNLAFLAVPKTGTTAVEMSLRKYADIIFAKSRKHLTAGQFHNRVAPFLNRLYKVQPERLAVMREPVEQIRSWYRYRLRLDADTKAKSSAHVSFDEFVRAVISDDPPPFAGIGSQYRFLTLADGTVPLHHLFAYEDGDRLLSFFEDRFQRALEFPPRNVSPLVDAPLSPETERALRQARAQEFDLYDRLRDAGGYLQPFSG
jgi:hypothetical protein